jgi:hypothetical protein
VKWSSGFWWGDGYTSFVALDAQGHDDGVDHELRAWIKSLARRPSRHDDPDRFKFSPEAAAYLNRIATDGTLKAALQEIGASEPDLAD